MEPLLHRSGRDLFTRNLRPGERVYGEDLRVENGVEYRRWDPYRSKLAAFLLRGGRPKRFDDLSSVLYLGGGHGTTVSHLSDLLPTASIYVVEKSPAAFAPLLELSKRRPNLWPILADAQLPERYIADTGVVDFVYQDVAQRNQAQIFLENVDVSLRSGGGALLMLKVRSVTQTKPPAQVIAETRRLLEQGGLGVEAPVSLTPFARDHAALLVARR